MMDIFDTPELLRADAPTTSPKRQANRRKMPKPFYMAPEAWIDRAAEVCGGKQMVVALRIYKWWFRRPWNADSVSVSNLAIGDVANRRTKLLAIRHLAEAGLLEVVESGPGRSPRVRVLDLVEAPT